MPRPEFSAYFTPFSADSMTWRSAWLGGNGSPLALEIKYRGKSDSLFPSRSDRDVPLATCHYRPVPRAKLWARDPECTTLRDWLRRYCEARATKRDHCSSDLRVHVRGCAERAFLAYPIRALNTLCAPPQLVLQACCENGAPAVMQAADDLLIHVHDPESAALFSQLVHALPAPLARGYRNCSLLESAAQRRPTPSEMAIVYQAVSEAQRQRLPGPDGEARLQAETSVAFDTVLHGAYIHPGVQHACLAELAAHTMVTDEQFAQFERLDAAWVEKNFSPCDPEFRAGIAAAHMRWQISEARKAHPATAPTGAEPPRRRRMGVL